MYDGECMHRRGGERDDGALKTALLVTIGSILHGFRFPC